MMCIARHRPPRPQVVAKPFAKPFAHADRLLPGANFGDTHVLVVTGLALDAVGVSQQVFGRQPSWIKWLLALRNGIVAPFGLKTGPERGSGPNIGFLPVVSQSTNCVVFGFDDWHLDFRVLLEVRECTSTEHEISVSTAVKTHNSVGSSYLALVKPFHRIIVPAMLMQVVSGH
ncbi:DUF2867 domain-containing protein [Mesorhizobium escarrei]|uniref:DUF2867 domain-containing protein n=1 Tax=Mesorhizobium escarrei TaxID=666018 RepID=A0ABN8K692_9HYPH|nr:DUF2867 domain-containing protein [Mesorhizobium escarrei]CAH2404111.1 conserved hypothetical protein [Mesorhizobium escarrei]